MEFNFGLLPDPEDPRDYDEVRAGFTSIEKEKIPNYVSYVNSVKAPRDQGQYPKCVGFAGAAVAEYHQGIQYRSPEAIYCNRQEPQGDGMTLRDCMKILTQIGTLKEKEFPYGTKKKFADFADRAEKIEGTYFKITGWDNLKAYTAQYGPSLIGLPVYNSRRVQFWRGKKGEEIKGYHALAIFGYSERKGKNYIILRNSWGTDNKTRKGTEPGYWYMPIKHFKKNNFTVWALKK